MCQRQHSPWTDFRWQLQQLSMKLDTPFSFFHTTRTIQAWYVTSRGNHHFHLMVQLDHSSLDTHCCDIVVAAAVTTGLSSNQFFQQCPHPRCCFIQSTKNCLVQRLMVKNCWWLHKTILLAELAEKGMVAMASSSWSSTVTRLVTTSTNVSLPCCPCWFLLINFSDFFTIRDYIFTGNDDDCQRFLLILFSSNDMNPMSSLIQFKSLQL